MPLLAGGPRDWLDAGGTLEYLAPVARGLSAEVFGATCGGYGLAVGSWRSHGLHFASS